MRYVLRHRIPRNIKFESLGMAEETIRELSEMHFKEFGRPVESIGDLLEVLE